MGTFHYCSCQDEMLWYVHADTANNNVLVEDADLGEERYQIQHWAKTEAFGDVIAWNCVTKPEVGETDWARKIVPQGNIILFFSDKRDQTYFLLKWRNSGKIS